MSHVFRLGLFVVGALLVFAGGVFLIGNRQMLFTSGYHLNAEFANVAGLGGGAEVRVGGLHQGSVTRITLPKGPDQSVTVTMNMEKGSRQVIRKDSVASIAAEGLVGDKYVEITFGSAGAPEVKDGDTIRGAPPVQMADLLNKSKQLLDTATTAVEGIGASAENLKSISAKINSGQGTVGALINDKTIYKEAAAGATELQEDMEALKHNFFLRGFFKKRGYEDSIELKQHEIAQLPGQNYQKKFIYDSARIFDKPDVAELKHEKALSDAGQFLQQNKFGLAVVAARTGMKGDTQQNRALTEAQSMVVRDYLAKNFKFDDTRLKTIGLGKDADDSPNQVEIFVYPPATPVPGSAAK